MLIAYTNYLCVCVCPGESIVMFNATPNPFLLNKICLNQRWEIELLSEKVSFQNSTAGHCSCKDHRADHRARTLPYYLGLFKGGAFGTRGLHGQDN